MNPLRKANLDYRRQRVVMMTLQNYTAREIAMRLGVTERTITKDRAATGVSRTKSPTDTTERREKVAALTHEGWTIAKIAELLRVTERTIERDREKLKISGPKPRLWTEEEHQHALALIADGCSLSEVADTVGRSYAAVCDRFPGMGWTPEQAGQYNRLRTLRKELGV